MRHRVMQPPAGDAEAAELVGRTTVRHARLFQTVVVRIWNLPGQWVGGLVK